MLEFTLEKEYSEKGYLHICGVDEAGRGPLCGPVVAAACILPIDCEIEGLNDSKKLSEKKREALFEVIKEKAISYSIAEGSVEEINTLNQLLLDLAKRLLASVIGYRIVSGGIYGGV